MILLATDSATGGQVREFHGFILLFSIFHFLFTTERAKIFRSGLVASLRVYLLFYVFYL